MIGLRSRLIDGICNIRSVLLDFVRFGRELELTKLVVCGICLSVFLEIRSACVEWVLRLLMYRP